MKFKYSSCPRTLEVFGGKMIHIFDNVNESEVTALVADAKFKESVWSK